MSSPQGILDTSPTSRQTVLNGPTGTLIANDRESSSLSVTTKRAGLLDVFG